jgi:hypothetical protein
LRERRRSHPSNAIAADTAAAVDSDAVTGWVRYQDASGAGISPGTSGTGTKPTASSQATSAAPHSDSKVVSGTDEPMSVA